MATDNEQHHGAGGVPGSQNYVFRWNARRFRDVSRSYLLGELERVCVIRFWDHNVTLRRLANAVGGGRAGLAAARATYAMLDLGCSWVGNAIVGIALKKPHRATIAATPTTGNARA